MYGKIFASMYEGSLVGAGPVVFSVLGYCISRADPVESTVMLNPTLISGIIGTTKEEIEKAINFLTSPDKNSKNPDHEGRRLLQVSGYCYFFVSHQHYRSITSMQDVRSYEKERKRKQREKEVVPDIHACPGQDGTLVSASVSGINSIELNKESIVLIVDLLNQTCGTSYRASSEKTAKHINARLNEKFTVEDFKAVIRFKNEQWGEDEKMKEYLRPETLFGSKFESYLQAAPRYEAYRVDSDEEETGPLLSIVDQIKADAERNRSGLNDK